MATPAYIERWAEGRKYLSLCNTSLRDGNYPKALELLHQAHNLGRDNIPLHAMTHLRYVRFSVHESNYRRALGHIFWAITSPIMVPLERNHRTAVVGEWTPAPKAIETPAPTIVAINPSSPGVDAR